MRSRLGPGRGGQHLFFKNSPGDQNRRQRRTQEHGTGWKSPSPLKNRRDDDGRGRTGSRSCQPALEPRRPGLGVAPLCCPRCLGAGRCRCTWVVLLGACRWMETSSAEWFETPGKWGQPTVRTGVQVQAPLQDRGRDGGSWKKEGYTTSSTPGSSLEVSLMLVLSHIMICHAMPCTRESSTTA